MRDKACFPEVVRDDRERERRGGVREKGEMERETKLERLPRTTFTCTSVIWLLWLLQKYDNSFTCAVTT